MLIAAVLGALILYLLALLAGETSRAELLARVEARPDVLIESIAGLVPAGAFALYCLRRSRRRRR